MSEDWTGRFTQGQGSLDEVLDLRAGVAAHQKLQNVIRNVKHVVTHSFSSRVGEDHRSF